MDIHQLSRLAGLSRGQISQMISRYHLEPHARPQPGRAREFTPADVFRIMVAGQLAGLGLNQRLIVEGLSYAQSVNRESFEQTETYPNRRALEQEDANIFLVFFRSPTDGFFCSEFVAAGGLLRFVRNSPGLVIVDATIIARRIDAANSPDA